MICLRRAAFRVLASSPSKSTSLSIKSQRSITSVTNSPSYRLSLPRSTFSGLQRRWASEEAATQSEPEADGAAEASHGDNSIAASSDLENDTQKASEAPSSTVEKVTQAAEAAKDSVKDAAESVGAATGLDSLSSSPATPGVEDVSKRTVYVGNLFFDVRDEDLKREFSRAGKINTARISIDQRGLSKGFGHIEFATIAEAEAAVNLFNLQTFEGRRISVQISLPRTSGTGGPSGRRDGPLHTPTRTLYIGNMSFEMSDRDLNNLFRTVKNVIDVRVAIDRRTGQPRGFAHADFIEVKDAQKALAELQGKEVCGRPLRVDYSTTTGRAAMPRQEDNSASAPAGEAPEASA